MKEEHRIVDEDVRGVGISLSKLKFAGEAQTPSALSAFLVSREERERRSKAAASVLDAAFGRAPPKMPEPKPPSSRAAPTLTQGDFYLNESSIDREVFENDLPAHINEEVRSGEERSCDYLCSSAFFLAASASTSLTQRTHFSAAAGYAVERANDDPG